MRTPTPLDIANTVARNLVPLGGILFLGWPAANVFVLYFVDTMLAMMVLFAGLTRYFIPPPEQDSLAARINAEAGAVGAALLITVVIAIPLGIPVLMILGAGNVDIGAMFRDEMFRGGLVMQAIAAFWSGWGLYRALRTHTPEQLRLKRRFALVFLRWMAVLMVTYAGFVFLLGRFASFILVVVYVGATIVIDVAPDKFLRAMPGGAEDADPLPGTPAAAANATLPQAEPRRKRKRKR